MESNEPINTYFKTECWPTNEVKRISLPLPNNLVARAAKIMAVAAYPKDRELNQEGPAHEFSQAMLAWMFRGAKALGKINQLPPWVAAIKTQQMNGRFNRGCRRLHYRLISFLTFQEAIASVGENQNVRGGMIPGFTIRSSEDFSQWAITFQPHTEAMIPDLWQAAKSGQKARGTRRDRGGFPTSMPGTLRSSFRAAILRHRKAFGVGSGDPDLDYKNIYNRHLRLLFPVLPIMSVLHSEFLRVKRDRPNVNLAEALLMAPEWAESAPSRIRERAPVSILQMRLLKIPVCDCRLICLGSRWGVELLNMDSTT
jgi:hypothetical protein